MFKKKAIPQWYVFEYRGKGREPFVVKATSLGKAWRKLRRSFPHAKKKQYLVRDRKSGEKESASSR